MHASPQVKHELNQIDHVTRVYIEDVEDTFMQAMADAKQFIDLCESIVKENRNLRDDQQSNVMYLLTLVTAIFIPLQFITGMYGMNFVREDGTPSMPELTWENGYAYFWSLVTGIFLTTITILIILGRYGYL
eukprot:CAMPEP_0170198830 /NCGR_PEP_ID=MMETSP0040_2-20121228/68998_1 /TAXON_ID=641309 /ORGANISM="Lotharella oceanica, Strain CCMP622" /LENGTH=131 /DNA_ID=CAMNT_0010448887 /DNA_START=628 /DNA_END=1024 /DNA_ORIENTATION=-